MSPSLYFKDQHKKYLLVVRKDPYKGIVNPYFLELQQKNAEAGQNCPYGVGGRREGGSSTKSLERIGGERKTTFLELRKTTRSRKKEMLTQG